MTETRSSQDIILAEVLAAETAVWRALTTGDAAADASLLSHDFLGVYPSGYANRAEHCGQLAEGPTIARFRLEAVRVITPAPGVALLSYRAHFHRPDHAEGEVMYVSSLWRHANGAWINLFSQDTPVS